MKLNKKRLRTLKSMISNLVVFKNGNVVCPNCKKDLNEDIIELEIIDNVVSGAYCPYCTSLVDGLSNFE